MLRTILIENDTAFLDAFANELLKHCPYDVQILAACSSPADGLKAITKLQPDLVFLDIDMPGMNGFELLEILGENLRFDVVFVTAYNEYAVRAFQISAIHYLLKPVTPDQLIEAVKRVKERHNPDLAGKSIQWLLNNNKLPDRDQKIALPSAVGYDLIAIKDIMYCTAEGNFSKVYIKGIQRPIMTARLLGFMEKSLPKEMFFRIHSGNLINRDFLTKYVRGDGGYVVMSNEASLPVSRNCKEPFLQWLGIEKKDSSV